MMSSSQFTTHSYRSQESVNLRSLAAQLGGQGPAAGAALHGPENSVQGEIGVDFVPPLNAGLVVTVPVQTRIATPAAGAVLGGEEIREVPEEFSWKDPESIRKYKGWTVPDGTKYLEDPPNQGGCGACWAINSAAVLSDRYAIWENGQNPHLSGTFLISCNTRENTGLCRGGTTGEAGQWFEKQGVPKFECWDYSWCNNDPGCRGGTSDQSKLNSLVPPCQLGTCMHSCSPTQSGATVQCQHSGTPTFFRAVHNSTEALGNPEAIKAEVFHRGPVVATYRVFGDFLAGTLPSKMLPQADGWKKTGGIYVHLPTKDLYGYGSIACAGIQKSAFQCYIGNHAVSIIGWGKKSGIPNFLDEKGEPLTLEYWIVRNSWGEKWNGDGYFHIAISDMQTGINSEVAFDRIVSIGGQLFGGGTKFVPETTWQPRDVGPSVVRKLEVSRSMTLKKKKNAIGWIIIGLLILAAAIFIGIWIEHRTEK